MESKVKCFDGSGNVKVFIEKVSIHSSLKGYDGEKAAQNLASKLEGPAFDVYMRLSCEDKKKPEKIKSELLKEFEKGKQDREEAIFELTNRKRKPEESAQTFAYKIIELVRLAYPSFDENSTKTIAKDYFIKGLHEKMQIALKSLPSFADAEINDLATETTRLQLAGIEKNSAIKGQKMQECMNVDSSKCMIDAIAEKVAEKLIFLPQMLTGVSTVVTQLQISLVIKDVGTEAEETEEIEETFKTDLANREEQIQEMLVVFNPKRSVVPAKVRTTFTRNAPNVIAKHVVLRVMMLGAQYAPSIND